MVQVQERAASWYMYPSGLGVALSLRPYVMASATATTAALSACSARSRQFTRMYSIAVRVAKEAV